MTARVASFGLHRLGDELLTGLLDTCTNSGRLYVQTNPITRVRSPSDKVNRKSFLVKQYAPHHPTHTWELMFDRIAESSTPAY